MVSVLNSVTFIGIEAVMVRVEVYITNGIPGAMIVGLPDVSTRESRDRVKAAIRNSGLEYPVKKITVNLAPADLRKEGPVFDLPLALGILIAAGKTECSVSLDEYLIAGELSLNGAINPIGGIIAISVLARKLNKKLIIPYANAASAEHLGVSFIAFDGLRGVWNFISSGSIDGGTRYAAKGLHGANGSFILENFKTIAPSGKSSNSIQNWDNRTFPDFSEIIGQEYAKRALTIAVSGHHNILITGPPGIGKTMLAHAVEGIQPELQLEESIETSNIYSFSGKKNATESGLISKRPFISVHHTISMAGLIGGGALNPVPGDISLAHNGTLFIDELPELGKKILDGLRQPLEDKFINLSRSRFSIKLPCNFMLVAAMNPCPCGFYGDANRECKCSSSEIYKFYTKISGPILDRFDIFIEMYPSEIVSTEKICSSGTTSEAVKKKVDNARNIQFQRYKDSGIRFNSSLMGSGIENILNATDSALNLAKKISGKLKLSTRGYFRLLKVSRTIADVDGKEAVDEDCVLESSNYRNSKFLNT